MPGMAGQATVLGNHDAAMVGHPRATWGVTSGNPIWEEAREVALKVAPLFLLNVTLNKDKQITGVFAGDLDAAHAAGCAFVRETAMVRVEHPFDIVLTSNSGYPLDLNLYQSVKGMSAAAQVVRAGGSIVIAADCWDGIPSMGCTSSSCAPPLRRARCSTRFAPRVSRAGPVGSANPGPDSTQGRRLRAHG